MITSDIPVMFQRIPILLFLAFAACKDETSITHKEKRSRSETHSVIPKKDTAVHLIYDTTICIYLTFDDGPYVTTPKLVSMLTRKEFKASFFMIGSQKDFSHEYDSVFQSVKANPLFRIYNHTYSHAITHGRIGKYYSRPDHIWKDIEKNKEVLQLNNNITRLPGMNAWRVESKKTISTKETAAFFAYMNEKEIDEQIIGWDFEWKERHSRSVSQVNALISEIKKSVAIKGNKKKDIVILAHDYLFRTNKSLDNLNYFIEKLMAERNVGFKWVEELLPAYTKVSSQ